VTAKKRKQRKFEAEQSDDTKRMRREDECTQKSPTLARIISAKVTECHA